MTEVMSEQVKQAIAHVRGLLIDKLRPEQLLYFAKQDAAGFEKFRLSLNEITLLVVTAEDDTPRVRNSDVAMMLLQFMAVSEMVNELRDELEPYLKEKAAH